MTGPPSVFLAMEGQRFSKTKKKLVLFLPVFHFNVDRRVSKYIWIYKTGTEMYRVIYDVCSCECSVNSLREICKRFNIWTRHLWKKFTSRPCISIATNIRRGVGVGWKGWKVGHVLSYQSRS